MDIKILKKNPIPKVIQVNVVYLLTYELSCFSNAFVRERESNGWHKILFVTIF